jgi:PAS domain S-box-containing protein
MGRLHPYSSRFSPTEFMVAYGRGQSHEVAREFIATFNAEGRFTSANEEVLNVSGYTREELLRLTILDVIAPGSIERGWAGFQAVMSHQAQAPMQLEFISRQRESIWLEVSSRRIRENGVTVGIKAIGRAISCLKCLEEYLVHLQKTDAMGRVASGVAHDFNDLLAVIIGNCELSLEALREGDPLRSRIEMIKKAGQRAADVTRQLTELNSKQVLAPKMSITPRNEPDF